MKCFPFVNILLICLVMVFMAPACRTASIHRNKIPSLKFLDQYTLPFETVFEETPVGGLSGIDYDAQHNQYYLVCDDRSDLRPARFYTARIIIREKQIDTVIFLSKKNLLRPDGTPYPSAAADPRLGSDPEAIRYHPVKNELFWSSEGERLLSGSITALVDPFIHAMDTTGKFRFALALPSNMVMQTIEKGPRRNGVLEGLCFDEHYQYLYASVEEPLYEDGPKAATGDSAAWIRLIRLTMDGKNEGRQYAYRIDPVKWPPVPASAFKVNGVSEILYAGRDRLIVMERSYSVGRTNSGIRLYLADLSKADDVSGIGGLHQASFRPASKTLLLDLDTLGMEVDNLEGICWGPMLPGGKKSLVLVSDNNFSKSQQTQFFIFEYNED